MFRKLGEDVVTEIVEVYGVPSRVYVAASEPRSNQENMPYIEKDVPLNWKVKESPGLELRWVTLRYGYPTGRPPVMNSFVLRDH